MHDHGQFASSREFELVSEHIPLRQPAGAIVCVLIIQSGLAEGDIVVTSGNFLVAAESRLKSATKPW